ncbi:MAG: hypothetical protein Q9M97_01145 [Candidatus Gracilibacteria bacterium]|nr:hypothetical protein [Candidatus Gracilibacteria bacterium]
MVWGIGAYFSRFLEREALKNLLRVEIILSIIGATSVIILKLAYIYLGNSDFSFQFIYFFLTVLIGSLVGIEIPLVATVYKELKIKTKSIISDIFTFDYIGGLLASLLFPIILLPYLGLYNISIFIGSLNLLVAFLYLNYLKNKNKKLKIIKNNKFFIKYYLIIFGVLLYFIFLLTISQKLENFYLKFYFKEPILQTYQTDYQNIVLTKRGEDLRMYLNGNIQFNSLDENRYHEALVDWPMKLINTGQTQGTAPTENCRGESCIHPIEVLVLGGGDGLAVRNLLEYDFIDNITLVELDPKMIEISSKQRDVIKLNKNSLSNIKVNIINIDAFKFIKNTKNKYDFIIADFPDPRDVGTAKLYSKEFYIGIHGTLKKDGIFVTQSSSSFFATKAFWSIDKTINSVFGNSLAYHRYLPSFGDWGFVLSKKGILENKDICPKLGCTGFDNDYLGENKNVEINTLTNPKIIEYYLEGYKKFNL